MERMRRIVLAHGPPYRTKDRCMEAGPSLSSTDSARFHHCDICGTYWAVYHPTAFDHDSRPSTIVVGQPDSVFLFRSTPMEGCIGFHSVCSRRSRPHFPTQNFSNTTPKTSSTSPASPLPVILARQSAAPRRLSAARTTSTSSISSCVAVVKAAS